MSKRIYFRNFKKANFIYPKNCLPLWIKNFLYKNNTSGKYELSEIQTGAEFTLNNTVKRKFNIFDLKGNTFQNGEPTPEAPIPIHNVSGNNTIKIQNKNLFNVVDIKNKYPETLSTETINNILDITANTTVGAQYADYIVKNLDNTKNYTISFKAKKVVKGTSGNSTLRCVLAGSVDETTFTNITNVDQSNPTQGQEYSLFYVLTGYNTYRFRFYNNLATPVTEGEKTQYYEIQLEQGSTATTYVAHQEQNLPFTFAEGQKAMQGTTLQDDGIHQTRKQVIFDGSSDEEWSQASNLNRFIIVFSGYKKGLNLVNYICNYFQSFKQTNAGGVVTEENCINFDSSGNHIRFYISSITTIESWKAWLQEHPVIVEYELAEEEIIPYTATQQAQYNAIKQAKSYNDQTNISQTNDDLPFIIDLQYWKLKEI
jgi:hypothetical protein